MGENNDIALDERGKKIKSVNAELHSYVIFYNRTSRIIDLLWCDYTGQEVKYISLHPETEVPDRTNDNTSSYSVNTFVSHPWVARDSMSGALLRVNQNKYYLPTAYDGEQFRIPVYIDIPVFSLKDRCVEVIKELMDVNQLSSDEIPPTLIHSLKQNRTDSSIAYEDYINEEGYG